MAKKPLSDEQKEALKARLAAGREAAKAKREADEVQEAKIPVNHQKVEAKKTVEVDASVIEELMRKVQELEKLKNPSMTPETALATTAQMQGYDINVGRNGVQGRVFKYPVEKSFYPDPTERLYDEPRLSRFNLRENYFFDWDVEGVEYEKYGVTYAEPRFTVRLFRRMFDENGEPTGRMALVNRAIQHEDEIIARIGAEKLGIEDSFESFQHMMNEMRFYRFRSWLLELFTPPKVEQHNHSARQMVVDGKVVDMYDTEVLLDKGAAESKASSIASQVRL